MNLVLLYFICRMNDFEFQFFPNPVRNTIKVVVALSGKRLNLEITDLFGNTVMRTILSSNVSNIDVTRLQTGCYELSLSDGGEKSAQPFVIER